MSSVKTVVTPHPLGYYITCTRGSVYSLDWTAGLDYWTNLQASYEHKIVSQTRVGVL